MAGQSRLFDEAGFRYPKNLVEIAGSPLVERFVDSVATIFPRSDARVFLINEDEDRRYHTGSVISLLDPAATVIKSKGTTAGAACTALLASEWITNDQPLLIMNGDILLLCGLSEAIESFQARDLDGGVMVFDGVHPRWSYVRVDEDDRVVEAAEKRPISRLATTGVYYFRQGIDFVESAKAMIRKDASVDGSFYVCPCYNEMVLAGKNIGVFRVERDCYHSLATPQGVEDYERFLLSQQRKAQ